MSRFEWPVPGEVHLHATQLDTAITDGALSGDERLRSARFRFDRDRRRFIAGRSFLRAVLAGYLDVPPRRVRLAYTPHGKPVLFGADSLHFNFSNAGEWGVLGVARSDIGVDVEQIRPIPDLDDVARDFFAAGEAEAVLAAEGEERVARFLSCWTRKEAFVKATGVGIGTSMRDFEVTVTPADSPRITRLGNEHASGWSLLTPRVHDDLVVALVVRHPDAWIGLRRSA